MRGLGRAPDPEPFSKAFYRGRATALAEALALSDVESQQGPEAAWGAWDEMMGYSDAIEHELIDRHNAVAWASGDGHAIPR